MSNREPMWFCHECHAEMRPLMMPDPHCASCNGTFVEMIEGPSNDPRDFGPDMDPFPPFHGPGPGLGGLVGLLNLMSALPPPPAPRHGGSTGIRVEVRDGGGGGRTIIFGGPPGAAGGAGEVPTLGALFRQAFGAGETGGTGPQAQTHADGQETRGTPGTAEEPDPRAVLRQLLFSVLNRGFLPPGGPSTNGQWGDYVLNQDGLDQIMTQLMEAANAANRPNPAPQDVIANLPRTKLTPTCDLVQNNQSCAICTEPFVPPSGKILTSPEEEEPTEALTLPCHHAFHTPCIEPWLKHSGTCPVCRYALVDQPVHNHGPASPGTRPNTSGEGRSGGPLGGFTLGGSGVSSTSNNPTYSGQWGTPNGQQRQSLPDIRYADISDAGATMYSIPRHSPLPFLSHSSDDDDDSLPPPLDPAPPRRNPPDHSRISTNPSSISGPSNTGSDFPPAEATGSSSRRTPNRAQANQDRAHGAIAGTVQSLTNRVRGWFSH